MSMVEKVARAILNAHAGDIPVHDADLQWSWWIEEARAAIEAMREPGPVLMKAGATRSAMEGPPEFQKLNAAAVWQAMIQAALEGDG